MPSPFPGMDPYIERPAIFPDFHDHLITAVKAALQPVLRPRYVALGQNRTFIVESDRPIFPDLAIVRTQASKTAVSGTASTMELDSPAVFKLWREEVREAFIEIVEATAGNRVVTAIEVLSPDNKKRGAGRRSYLQKRGEYWAAGANLVEIDLLRAGQSTVRVSKTKLENLRPWHYVVAVKRHSPPVQAIYAFPLQRRLPRIAVPLGPEDKDAPLDLQAAFTRCWDEGPYPELLRYEGPPPGRMKAEEIAWCEEQLRAAGHRPAPPAPPPPAS